LIRQQQLFNECRDAEIEAARNPNKPPTAMELKFAELFPFQLPKAYEQDFQNHNLEHFVYSVFEDVAARWFASHPAAQVHDVCRIINAVLRKKAAQRAEDHCSAERDVGSN
jgi:hypothetical protein